jgi:hypothetical protein
VQRLPELPAGTTPPDTPQDAHTSPVRGVRADQGLDGLLDRLRRVLRLCG